jgi:hypothetical protein
VIDLTVVTATLPERVDMLHELRQSLAMQTVRPRWVVATDWHKVGPSKVINELVDEVDTTWLFRCDDDDLFDPEHFATIAAHLNDDHDIVYTWPRVDPPGWIGEDGLQFVAPLELLREANFIASAAAIRVSLWRHLGGYRAVHNEDHDLWVRALDAGARFLCVPQVTWTYRLGNWPHLSEPEDWRR